MKSIRLMLVSLLLASAGCLALASPASAGVSCHQINAKGVGQDLGGGRTHAEISGGGLLRGSTDGDFAMSSTSEPTVFAIAGTVVFHTRDGGLTVAVDGTFDIATGAFQASGPVTDSSGKLAGATGGLTLTGKDDLATGAFTETVRGEICADLAP